MARIPRAAKACALIAFVNALAWALLIPPYQVPDETAHVAYIQYFAETGKLPTHKPGPELSSEQQAEIVGLRFYSVVGNRADKPPWSTVEQERLERNVEGKASDDAGYKTVATNQPPLYHAVEAVAYRAAPGAGLMTRLYFMRVVSALMAAATVLFTFMFLRELLPGTPWSWTVGALAVAFQPMFAFESGGVNNDNLMYLTCAALFFALARAFQRGLTPRRGAAIGAALGLGLITKITVIAFVPAVALALVWLVWRDARRADRRSDALRALAVAAAVALAPVVIYAAANSAIFDRPLYQGGADGAASAPPDPDAKPIVLREQLVYTWQLFLPRLPFMTDTFGTNPIWDTWFTGFNGRFGWLDYAFPPSFYTWIWWLVFLPLLLLAARALWSRREALVRRLPELAVYGTAVVGLMLVIGRPSYTEWLVNANFPFYQPRYVLPLLPLYGALVALAVLGSGRRFAPYVGTALVMLAFAHNLFAQLLTVSRYYA